MLTKRSFFPLTLQAPRYFTVWICVVYALLSLSKFVLPATDRDESRFAQASKQMIESGDYWSINFLDQPRNKKPIGIYWLQAATTKVAQSLGLSSTTNQIWTYRLPTLIGGLLVLLLFYRLFRRLIDPGAVAFATGLLGLSLLLMIESHLAKTDTVLLLCLVVQQGCLANWFQAHLNGASFAPRLQGVLWGAVALGILIKGPVAPLIMGLTLLSLRFWFKERLNWSSLGWRLGCVFVAIVTAFWFGMLQLKSNGAYAAHALGVDFFPKLFKGQESHGFYPGYYTLLTPIFLWPGSLFVLLTVGKWRQVTHHPMGRFALAWLVPSWVLFEVIPTKLPHYVLPLLPAVFLLTVLTYRERGWTLHGWSHWIGKSVFVAVTLVLVLIGYLLSFQASFSFFSGGSRLDAVFSSLPLPVMLSMGGGFFILAQLRLLFLQRGLTLTDWLKAVIWYYLFLALMLALGGVMLLIKPNLFLDFGLWPHLSVYGLAYFAAPAVGLGLALIDAGLRWGVGQKSSGFNQIWGVFSSAVSAYLMLFLGLLPNVPTLWVSEQIYAVRQEKDLMQRALQVVGFNEPSLFFRNGTAVKSVSFDQALVQQNADLEQITILPQAQVQAFLDHSHPELGVLTQASGLPLVLESVNYSKGKKTIFQIIGRK